MNPLQSTTVLLGRICLCTIFILSGLGKIGAWEATAERMADAGIPLTDFALGITIAIEIAAGLMIAIGLYARWAAFTLVVFLIPTTLLFHNPLLVDEGQREQLIQALKNLAIAGGLLMLAGSGAGAFSFDRWRRRRKKKS